jgi:hypothetical protein
MRGVGVEGFKVKDPVKAQVDEVRHQLAKTYK